MPTRYEYTRVVEWLRAVADNQPDPHVAPDHMNQMAAAGWDLVSASAIHEPGALHMLHHFYWRREPAQPARSAAPTWPGAN